MEWEKAAKLVPQIRYLLKALIKARDSSTRVLTSRDLQVVR